MHIPPAAESYRDDKFVRTAWFATTGADAEPAGLGLLLSGHTHKYAERPADANRAFPTVGGRHQHGDPGGCLAERLELTTFTNDGKLLSRPPAVRPER